ncbi:ATP-dependent DNA helicase Q-like 2 [Nematostella vectensis]|uniref:ATP-dependent DNA helicase Q-like 2 n=1 Tax=Nematostella vectensis TaxID=45351 RepID=UPI0020779063|nr:ATP-dependent DNA helicase Q-like 2 [Nematostella vectensis]
MDAKESFKWLVNEINERKDGGDKTIIYCQTIKQCSLVYGTLRSMLIELVANGKPKLEMLHSCTPKQNKDAILESFKRLDGHVQVLVATIAFSMGIDCKCVHRTIHFGPSKNCEAFIQETGRAGRDGKSSFSYLLYKGIMLNHLERDIKEYVKATTCRRQVLMKHFSKNHIVFSGDLHACCDNCAKACECGSENCESYTDFMVMETGIASEEKRRSVSEDQKKELSGLLKKYHKKLLMDLVRKSAHGMVQSLISINSLLGFGET